MTNQTFNKGDTVKHRAYGTGTVSGSRIGGTEVRVDFGAFSLWLPTRELTYVSQALKVVGAEPKPSQPRSRTSFNAILRMLGADPDEVDDDFDESTPPTTPAIKKASLPTPRFKPARQKRTIHDSTAIEAFRLGIVPQKHLDEWTVGREREVRMLRNFLHDPAEGAILIEGAYGAGKSHLLQIMLAETANHGYATSICGFDPSEATAAFPKKAYRRLVRNFRANLNGKELDFRGFWTEVSNRKNWRDVLGDHWFFAPFLKKLVKNKVDEEYWEYAEARGQPAPNRPTLHDFSTCANLYVNLLTATGQAATEILGMAGFAVLFDEAEVSKNTMYRYQAQRGVNFFRGLVMAANDEPALVEEDTHRIENTTVGMETGLVYSGHNPLRYSHGIPSGLKMAFALTPGSLQDEFHRTRESIPRIELDVLGYDQLRELFGRISDTFAAVYGIQPSPTARDRMFRLLATSDRVSSTRDFIKASTEALDFIRFYPEGNVEDLIIDGQA